MPFGMWLKRCAPILLAVVAGNAIAQMSVPPAYFPGRATKEARPAVEMRLPAGAPARRIMLAPPTAAEHAALKSASAASDQAGKPNKARRLAIGFARDVRASDSSMRIADLPWQTLPDRTQIARVELTSPGAVAIRIELALEDPPEGLVLRFRGSASGAPAFGPYPADTIARRSVFWTPVLEGETASVELELPASVQPGNATLRLPAISHLGAPASKLKALSSYIGEAEACEVDIACLAPTVQQQIATASNAVARLLVTVKGVTYLCSGTLLNDSLNSFTPYFLTANHCISGTNDLVADKGAAAAAASTVNTYWRFQAATCGSQAMPDYALIADGATLLARSVDYDWSLLRLNSAPPPGATFAAWNAAGPLNPGASAIAIHHPAGDLKKVTQGSVYGYSSYPDGSSFIQTRWTLGATEDGSSGGGLFTLNAANGAYELRGGLAGGSGRCGTSQGIDEFSRFDVAFPLVAPYLAQDAPNPAKTAPVTEFYNATLDDYFITADPAEINALDTGAIPGWVRTGLRFLAYTDPAVAPAGMQPVCRFRLPPADGGTHFYSASPQECADMLAGSAWVRESAAAFYVALPDTSTGSCPSGTRAIFRFANAANPVKRRYTAEVDVRNAIVQHGGWTQEGFGRAPDQAVMCAPAAAVSSISPQQGATNFGGLWWADPAGSESGWGLSIAHQGDIIFVGWFTYDDGGRPLWLSMTANKNAANSYSGLLIRTSGPPFSAAPFDPNAVIRTVVGAATLTFRDGANGTFAYATNGAAQSKAITRLSFGAAPTCTYSASPDLASATNYQDDWWVAGGAESGWGLMLTHESDVIFAVWYTYDANGAPLWMSATVPKVGSGAYSGMLVRSSGPPFNAVPFDPADVVRTPAGTITLAFADGNQATFTSEVGGITRTKAITRFLLAPPAGTRCQ